MKRILVTGASRGIGKELSFELASRGYNLILVSRNELLLQDNKIAIEEKYGVNAEIFVADVGQREDIYKLTSYIDETGGVYGIINNAAIAHVGLLTDMSCDEWNNIINVNLNSVFYITRNLLPSMINKKEGKVINISSIWGNVGASMEVAYSTTKGGVNMFTKALAKELAPSNIQVNAVAFGVIDTDMNNNLSAEEKEALISEIPADRMGTAKEAAILIADVFEAPEYLTGQIITMDGGFI